MVSRYKRISVNGETLLEHRYVMEQHIGRKLLHSEHVHHINGDRYDNRIDNLMILSEKEHQNLHHNKYPRIKICVICGKEYEPYESKRKAGKVCSKECKIALDRLNAAKRKRPIDQFTINGEFIRSWNSARDIQNETGFFESNINKCCNGKIRAYKGFVWKYSM